jgi:hypothetical protein
LALMFCLLGGFTSTSRTALNKKYIYINNQFVAD